MIENPLHEIVFNHVLLNSLIDDLSYNQINHSILKKAPKEIDSKHIRKGIWLASILANSNDEKHRSKAQLFASLVYLQNIGDDEIQKACYVLFSRLGNLAASRLLPFYSNFDSIDRINNDFDISLVTELQIERDDKTIKSNNSLYVTTRFQKKLWENLHDENRIIISAPTSAGKSFIIQKFIVEQLKTHDNFNIIYIVPSRALLNQVSEELRNEVDLDTVDVRTAYLPVEEADAQFKKRIYILTPERCLNLLKDNWEKEIEVDFIFVDEIQNVEDGNGRGTLFEYVFNELCNSFPKAKIVAAGPNISNSQKLFNTVFGDDGKPVETNVSPVFQLRVIVKPLQNNALKLIVKTTEKREQSFIINSDIDFRRSLNVSMGTGLKDIVNFFGVEGQNIIYAPRTDLVEGWTLKFAESNQDTNVDEVTNELIEFLREEIHPKYYLIPCLQKGTAFHHSKLPDIVRKEIEDNFLDGRIKNLFCTSTLLQGVNLPANNLFIASPRKRHIELSAFEFGNLLGRAGRIRDSLYGVIYCIEKDNEDDWAEELYEKSYRKDVITATENSISDFSNFLHEFVKPINEIENSVDEYTTILLRQKYLVGPEFVDAFLRIKNISEDRIRQIKEKLREITIDVSIPSDILRLNPTVDPILQNNLYNTILRTGIKEWVIPSRAENENYYKYIEDPEKYPFEKRSFYLQLNDIVSRLNLVFSLNKEAFYKHHISTSTSQMCKYAYDWLNNKSYRDIIDSDIDFYANHDNISKRINIDDDEAINDRINQVIKINSTAVTHVLVKYLKVLNDILGFILTDDQKEQYKFSMALPTMIELGTTEPIVMELISKGVPRSVALKIFKEFKKIQGYEDINVFSWLSNHRVLNLKPIYNRYLQRMRLLKLD